MNERAPLTKSENKENNTFSPLKCFHVITLFPEMIHDFFKEGVISKAITQKKIEINTMNPRKYTSDVHQTVDDKPFGGGDGMVMKPEPLYAAIKDLKKKVESNKNLKICYLSPQGQLWTQKKAQDWSIEKNTDLLLICGRYGGIDQRVIDEFVDEEISVGDYVISGGELGANIIIDSMTRLLPGVLGNELSSSEDSFYEGLLEAPQYTRPQEYENRRVPPVYVSGDHKKISEFQKALKMITTYKKRPDLFDLSGYTQQDYEWAWNVIEKYEKESQKEK